MCVMPKQNELLPSVEVCSILGIDRSTLTRWVASGLIQAAIKAPGLRGAYLFDPDEVERVKQATAA